MTATSVLLDPVVSNAACSGVLFDFDGTLSPLVDDPAAARPIEGSVEVLAGLVQRYGLVGIISGRPVEFLKPHLPEGMVVAGLYGLEVLRRGERVDHPYAGAWREAVEDVTRCSASLGPRGMYVEPKGLSLTLHYRSRPEIEDEVVEWADRQATRSGLVARPAKMSVELHPPIDADKGTAIEWLADDLEALCYVGDDLGDLPAFDALDRLADRGMHVLRVAVSGPETPAVLLDRADLALDGPDGVLRFIKEL